ncbi:MAG: sulfatase-like hydrolase/transferase [Planctomycetes bacterium]|nr:sulfatase-like hydrolase/transferase [Planctomycetota bacterium]
MRFTEAFCTTASCSASRSVILTGRFNQRTAQHGHIHGYHHFRTYRDVRLLPVRLSERGYSTARIGKFFVAPSLCIASTSSRTTIRSIRCRRWRPISSPWLRRVGSFFRSGTIEVFSSTFARPIHIAVVDEPKGCPIFLIVSAIHCWGGRRHGVELTSYRSEDVVVSPFFPDTAECRAELV